MLELAELLFYFPLGTKCCDRKSLLFQRQTVRRKEEDTKKDFFSIFSNVK